jgi:hypothetical protein
LASVRFARAVTCLYIDRPLFPASAGSGFDCPGAHASGRMNALLDREAITRALRRDKVLKRSLGLRPRFTLTKWFGILWSIWVVVLLLTPEGALIGRLSLMLTAIFTAFFLGLDAIQNINREIDLANRLFNLLEKSPNLEVQQKEGEETARIIHQKFKAECQLDTALLLDEMVTTERETKLTLESVSDPKKDPKVEGKNDSMGPQAE